MCGVSELFKFVILTLLSGLFKLVIITFCC